MPADGCRCVACFEDRSHAAMTAVDEAAIDRCLDRASHVRLHVVTKGPQQDAVAHDGSMTCPCSMCGVQRSMLRPQGAGNASPFRNLRLAA